MTIMQFFVRRTKKIRGKNQKSLNVLEIIVKFFANNNIKETTELKDTSCIVLDQNYSLYLWQAEGLN